ncbi:uncharacterized protein BBA_09492 [Beauveria bassiana ARSEF 2860]|uniref:Uncharacterized protein n=1 Tax=Beauveria bassiana (strain ARSEF 2860) TaxID=655819 RepID=J4UFY1_BEAB2|nr:uncharacterized protein BBA_09492 [Beauveria bassiana ARSEF 2860]EJP61582.1 hypothetical protein BBA_09492 [Beauveria bassiana ARSEF 2860]
MDPSKEPDVQRHMHTKYPSEEEVTSYGQLRGLYAVVDRDRRPIQVSPPCIHDWADLNVSSDDSTSNSDVSELDLNDVLEEQSIAPTAQDASDWGIPPNQTQGKATPSVADTSDLDSEWKSLSAEIWETVHTSQSDDPDPNDALQAQPTAATARPASNQDSPSDRTRATTTSSLISAIADLTDALKSTVNTAHAEPDFAYVSEQILATATLLVIARRRLAAATSPTSNIPSHSRWEAANRSAYNRSSSQRPATATTSASYIPPHLRWEAANGPAYDKSSSQHWATTTTPASDISSHQYKATANPFAPNNSSSQFWATAINSASKRSSHQRQSWAAATTSAPTQLAAPVPTNPIPSLMRSPTPTQRTWPAPDPSKGGWGAAYVVSTAVNDDPVLPFNPIWYTPRSIRNFKPLPAPPPTYENGGLPSTEPSSSENLVPDVADDNSDPVEAVDQSAAPGHVSPRMEPLRTIYGIVAAVRVYLRPFLNF